MPDRGRAVLSGSSQFTNPLLSPLMARFGAGLRVTSSPDDTVRHLRDGGVLLVEFQSERWLDVFASLGAARGPDRAPVTMVVSVPAARAESVGAIRGAGAIAVPAEKGSAAMLRAVERALSGEPPDDVLEDAGAAAPGSAAAVPAHALDDGVEIDDGGEMAPGSPPLVRSEVWPGTVPLAEEAEQLLATALSGLKPEGDAALDRVVAALSDPERSALWGDTTPCDPGPLRRAAVLKYQLAWALASAPPAGSQVDAAALLALTTAIDETLASVKTLAPAALPELAASLESIVRELVRDAVDLTEAACRLQPALAAAPVAAIPRPRPVAQTRVVEVRAEPERRPAARWGRWAALAVVAALAGAFHLNAYLEAHRPREAPPTVPGAPDGYAAVTVDGHQMLVSLDGNAPDPAQLEAFRSRELALGIEVRELVRGTYLLAPTGAAPAGVAP